MDAIFLVIGGIATAIAAIFKYLNRKKTKSDIAIDAANDLLKRKDEVEDAVRSKRGARLSSILDGLLADLDVVNRVRETKSSITGGTNTKS